jgi:FkbM family methyltransferase
MDRPMNALRSVLVAVAELVVRRVPAFPGRFRLAEGLLSWLRHNGDSMGTRVVRTRYGFRFRADLGDWLGQYVYLHGAYEPPTARVFAALVKPGDTVLDVGANSGFFSLLSAHLAGPRGRVFAFEPVPSVRDELEANLRLNQAATVEVVPMAVTAASGTVTIHEGPEGHKGISSLRHIQRSTQRIDIRAIALDDIRDRIGQPTLIKIDVEGAELLGLQGMDKLIAQYHPALIIEFTDAYLSAFGHSARQLSQWLEDRGYGLWHIDDAGLVPVPADAKGLPGQFNVLACRSLPAELAV